MNFYTWIFKRLNYLVDLIRFLTWKENNVALEPKCLFWIARYVADTDVANPNSAKTLFESGVSTFFNKDKLIFLQDQKY